MKKQSFHYRFNTSKTAEEVFDVLLDISQWWSGIYEETILGKSKNLNDEFTFHAGGGAHYSKQQLIEVVPGKKVVWRVTDSKLSFLTDTSEWNGSTLCFELSSNGAATEVTFTHDGLVPDLECYDACSGAWTGYLDNLKKRLN